MAANTNIWQARALELTLTSVLKFQTCIASLVPRPSCLNANIHMQLFSKSGQAGRPDLGMRLCMATLIKQIYDQK